MAHCHTQPIGPFTGAFRFLSNFFPSPVTFNRMEYGGSEMSQKDPKTRSAYNRQYYEEHRKELLPKIRERVREWQRNNRDRRR